MKLAPPKQSPASRKARVFATLASLAVLLPALIPHPASAQTSLDCSDPEFQQSSSCQQGNSSQQNSSPNQYQQSLPSQNVGRPNILPASPSSASRDVYTDSGGFNTDQSNNLQNTKRQTTAPEPPTDFQRLVRTATGQLLPVFGRELFRMPPSTFAPADQIPVTPDYVIGPGDQILVRVWGHDNFNGRLTVDRTGSIYIPQVGSIHVANEHFSELQDQIQREMSRTYRNFQLSVNMGQLRSIQVFVLGEALHPGAYTVSALSTAFNALLVSGGPTPQGSLRKIEVRRAGNTVATIDLYDFVLRGDKSKDIVLQSDDVLFIPAVGAQAAISGSIKHPAIYEFKEGTTIKDMLALAGGASPMASNQHVSIDRITDHYAREALTFPMDDTGLSAHLHDGDVIQVGSILTSYKDSVTIRGNLANAGRFPWHEGMKLSDIIPDRDSLLTNDYWLKRNRLGLPTPIFTPLENLQETNPLYYAEPRSNSRIEKSSPDSNTRNTRYGQQLQPNDSYQNLNQDSNYPTNTSLPEDRESQSEQQQVSKQNERYGVGITTQDASQESNFGSLAQQQTSALDNLATEGRKNDIRVPTPQIDWSYAVIERLDPITLRTSLVPFNLGRLVNEKDGTQDILLRPGDIVTILSQSDIHVAQEQQTKYIRLEGEFISAGVYSVAPDETLADVVRRAGGLTSKAYLFGASFTRESARVMQQQRLDEYINSLSIQLERSTAQRLVSSTTPTTAATNSTSEHDLIRQLKAMRATGRIVLEFTNKSTGETAIPAIPLENGDTFIVPSRPIVVSVVGAVNGQNIFLYHDGHRVSDYIKLAGDPSRIADSKHEFIIRADGSVLSADGSSGLWSDHFNSTLINPGDTIVVPEKPIKPSALRDVIDWSQVFSQFAIGAAAIEVIRQ